ncbi:phosphoglucomutase/phosphomannomutase family protein [Natronocalculus amylovorans]|uniref:Phosphoglucomutase/phosphomannomutase family protein n=1 Tax=Natronocalculus amylovorans TaxID=2917812 RepID=A0AAE3FVW7_9EURY|nr:phosphoglucomutase/phosphomannomutase family protein [Natronocalculus amylovorans]MCL9815943.1 phosphoglucomutase/phosphomannomutase family protein [Natronocalculus amylovorans]
MDAISFGTDGWRATLDTFTDDRVRVVGQAVANHLQAEDDERPVFIGYDARETSEGFAESLAEVLSGNGFDVLLPERDCPTPVAAYAIVDRNLAGALMVTASHNPPEYNGVKFIPDDGAPALPDVTESIESRLEEPTSVAEAERGSINRVEPVSAHAAHAQDLVSEYFGDVDLSDVTVVYDAIHGSGRGVTDKLLEAAGATVVTRRVDRDVTFGGGSPEPSAENLEGLVEAVQAHGADLGVANDGDADRIALCTPERGYLDENLFFAALYEALLESNGTEESGSNNVVRTVSTTFLLDRIADAHGESVTEVPVGFKWVAQGMDDPSVIVGGEESGGFSVRGHLREKDGVLMALVAAAIAAEQPFDERLDAIAETYGEIHADKISVACPDAKKQLVLDALEDVLPETVAGEEIDSIVTKDGFKLLLADGSWLLVRPSGTEPKLRVYAEASSIDRLKTVLEAGKQLVEPVVNAQI